MAVAKILVEQGRRLKALEVAKSLEVSTRSLRNWKTEYLEDLNKRIGRPPITLAEKLRVLKLVMKEWERQGRPGWRAISEELKGCSTALVQRYVSMLKKRERKKEWDYKKTEAKRVEVEYKDVMWTQDATYLKENKKRTYAEVLKDRCTLEVEVVQVDSMNTENVLGILQEKEVLPLVYSTDNGSAYCSRRMEDFLEKNRVIHLKNLPATPQHNGAAEVAVREVKRLSVKQENKGLPLRSCLKKAERIMNEFRLWRAHGYRTAREKAQSACHTNLEQLRDRIYNEYKKGIVLIKKTLSNKSKRRLEERELVFSLLEKYGLIKRYRGSQNYAM